MVKMAFSFFKQTFIRDDEKYKEKVKKNRENGLKGGRPKRK